MTWAFLKSYIFYGFLKERMEKKSQSQSKIKILYTILDNQKSPHRGIFHTSTQPHTKFQVNRTINEGEDFFMHENHILKLEIEGKECCQLMRKYLFLASKTSKSIGFCMGLCCKMAGFELFSKTWIYLSCYLLSLWTLIPGAVSPLTCSHTSIGLLNLSLYRGATSSFILFNLD